MASNRGLILFILIVVLRTSPINCDTQSLIATVCQSTEDHGFCTNVFNQNLKSPNTNMRGLAEIALEQGIKNASGSAQYAKDLSYQTKDPNLHAYLESCTMLGYLVALKDLQDGQNNLRQSKLEDMVTVLLLAPKSQASNCDGQPKIRGVPNPMNERNREMRILISMALATAFELKGGTPTAGNN